jgi:hypothetical protein
MRNWKHAREEDNEEIRSMRKTGHEDKAWRKLAEVRG